MKKIVTIILGTLAIVSTFAQSEFSMNMMEHVFQSTYVNPTARPDHKVSIGLPGMSSIYFGFGFTPFRFSDTYDKNYTNPATGAIETRYDVMKVAGLLNKESLIHTSGSVDLFHVRFKCRNTFLSFNARSVFDSYIGLPKSMGDLLTFSNVTKNTADNTYTGKTWDLNGFDANITHYNEYGIGLSTFQKKFVYSVKLKYLQGLSNMTLESENSSVVFNDQRELEAQGNLIAKLSSPLDTNNKVSDGYKAESYFTNFKNMGFGADLGVSYLFNSKLTFSLAVNNLGFINWRTTPISYETSASTRFDGIDYFNPIIRGEKPDLDLEKEFKYNKSLKDSYTSYLVPTFYFTTKYNFTPRFSVSGTVQTQKFNVFRFGLSAGAQLKMSRLLSLTGNVIYQYSVLNFGGGVVFKPGPVQIYLAIDHITRPIDYRNNSGNTVAYIPDLKQFNVRFGINFVFGREQVPQAQSLKY